jgi:hypothetical protein
MAKKSAPETDVRSLITEFTNQLTLAIRRATIDELVASLGGQVSAASPRRGPGRPRGSGRRGPKPGGTRRSSENMEKMSADLLAHVKSNPGSRGEQIAAALGTDVGTMRLPMRKLIAEKKVKTRGQRRGMTYFAAGAAPAGGGGGGGKKTKKTKSKARRKKKAGRKARRR